MLENVVHILTEGGDSRTKFWPLASFPSLVHMLVLYLSFCLYVGPRLMKNRKPFELKKLILTYNAFQVLFSVFLVYQAYRGGWFNGYSFLCAPLDVSDKPNIMNGTFWWYLLAKYTEFFDTVFFVLRKKTRQVSSLHVFHHVTVPIVSWIGVRYYPNGHGTAYLFLNSMVHVAMYSYYFLACLDPHKAVLKKIKKHITQIQMIQFTFLMVHNVQALFRECDFPKGVNVLVTTEAAILMVLFSKFYYHSYIKSKWSNKVMNDSTYYKKDLIQ